jgi:hypothetical protein
MHNYIFLSSSRMSVGCMTSLRAAPAAALLGLQLARPRTYLRFTKPITSRAKPPESENDQPPAWKRLLLLLLTSPGQVRSELDASSVRTWTEAMMLPSHAAFVPGIAIAVAQSPPLPELALLQSSVLALSLAYHRNFERTGALAQAEGASAKLLFLYGATQTLANCPAGQPGLFGAEACCLGLTLGCFVGTNFDKGLYERWHPWGLHVVPGVWSSLVALEHTSLLPPSAVHSLPGVASGWLP